MDEGVSMVSRIRRDAAIYRLAPKGRPKGKRGRKPKTSSFFVDMLSALRKVLWHDRISSNSRFSARVRELFERVSYALFAA